MTDEHTIGSPDAARSPAFDAWARDLAVALSKRVWLDEDEQIMCAALLSEALATAYTRGVEQATAHDAKHELAQIKKVAKTLRLQDVIAEMSKTSESDFVKALRSFELLAALQIENTKLLAAAVPAAQDAPPLSHQLNLMAIRGWIDEAFDEWAHTRSGPLHDCPLPPPNGYAGAAAAKVWQRVQEIVGAAHPARQEPTDE